MLIKNWILRLVGLGPRQTYLYQRGDWERNARAMSSVEALGWRRVCPRCGSAHADTVKVIVDSHGFSGHCVRCGHFTTAMGPLEIVDELYRPGPTS